MVKKFRNIHNVGANGRIKLCHMIDIFIQFSYTCVSKIILGHIAYLSPLLSMVTLFKGREGKNKENGYKYLTLNVDVRTVLISG